MSCVHRFARAVVFFLMSISALLAQTQEQQIQNLRAFSKLYGHIRYFHPSDEAAKVDWNKLAAYGAEKVKTAKNLSELKAALKSVFSPLGPAICVHLDGETCTMPKLDFSSEEDVVAWQHLGYGVEQDRKSSIYSSVRIGRDALDRAPDFSTYPLMLNAVPHRGKKIRFLADVKTDGLCVSGRRA